MTDLPMTRLQGSIHGISYHYDLLDDVLYMRRSEDRNKAPRAEGTHNTPPHSVPSSKITARPG